MLGEQDVQRQKHGRKMVGDKTVKSHLECVTVTKSQFADDVAVYSTSRDAIENATAKLVNTASNWGLTVSMEKKKEWPWAITMMKETPCQCSFQEVR